MSLSNIFKPWIWRQLFLYYKADHLFEKRKYEEAKKLLKDVLKEKIYVTEAHYYLLGKIYFEQKDFDTAQKCFLTSIENNVYDNIYKANTYFYLGLAYYESEKFQEAIEPFKKAIQIKKKIKLSRDSVMSLPHLYCYLGRSYVKLGEPEEAYQIFNEGLKYEPNNEALQRELTLLGI